jgi:hypothetical protein
MLLLGSGFALCFATLNIEATTAVGDREHGLTGLRLRDGDLGARHEHAVAHGAVAGERWAGKEWDLSIRIGWGALWGKLLGTLLKTICGTAMMVLLLYAVWT